MKANIEKWCHYCGYDNPPYSTPTCCYQCECENVASPRYAKAPAEAPVKIAELKALAKQKDLQAIVALTVSRNGTVSVVTYGENSEKCKAIGDWGQGLWRYAVAIVPFRTVFGWGNNGQPQPLTEAEKLQLIGRYSPVKK